MSAAPATPAKPTKSSYTTPICPRVGQRGEDGWEYRVRPTAIGPVELAEDLRYDQNKDGIVFRPSPHKASKRGEGQASPSSTRKQAAKEKAPQEQAAAGSDSAGQDGAPASPPDKAAPAKQTEADGGEEELSPEETFHVWVKDHFHTLQDAMTEQDKLGRGLLARKSFFRVLEKHSPPMSIEDIEKLHPPIAEKADYATVLSSWRSAGVRHENRKRAGPPPVAAVPLLAAQFPTRVISFDKLPEIRSNISAAASRVSRQRDMDRARATQAVIQRMNLDAVAPAPRRAIADACLVYSPSRKTAAKLLTK